MALARRDLLRLSIAAAVAMQLCDSVVAEESNGVASAIADFAGGEPSPGDAVLLEVPNIADNGGAVPVRVAAEGARRIALFTDGNPNAGVAVFVFGTLVPSEATIRIRLARSQNVIAVAEMADGTFRKISRFVAVTVGGCA